MQSLRLEVLRWICDTAKAQRVNVEGERLPTGLRWGVDRTSVCLVRVMREGRILGHTPGKDNYSCNTALTTRDTSTFTANLPACFTAPCMTGASTLTLLIIQERDSERVPTACIQETASETHWWWITDVLRLFGAAVKMKNLINSAQYRHISAQNLVASARRLKAWL